MKPKKENIKEIKKSKETPISSKDFELSDTGEKILQFSIQYPDLKDYEIAELLKIRPETVCVIKKSPAYQSAKKQTDMEARKLIIEARTAAARTVKDLMENAVNENVRLRAAEMLLGNVIDPKTTNLNIVDKEKLKSEIKQIFE